MFSILKTDHAHSPFDLIVSNVFDTIMVSALIHSTDFLSFFVELAPFDIELFVSFNTTHTNVILLITYVSIFLSCIICRYIPNAVLTLLSGILFSGRSFTG